MHEFRFSLLNVSISCKLLMCSGQNLHYYVMTTPNESRMYVLSGSEGKGYKNVL
jgi:hypothetical protein